MSHFAYYAEPSSVFEGYSGPVVRAHMVYNGLGEPVGAIPLLAALAPMAADLIGNLFNGSSSTAGIDGYGDYGEDPGLGLYAAVEPVPAQLVCNRMGEPVGAIPLLAALLPALAPLAAKAAGFIAPLAAKAASAIVPLASKAASTIVPLVSKAASAAMPLLKSAASQAMPQLITQLPNIIASMRSPMPMPGGPDAPAVAVPMGPPIAPTSMPPGPVPGMPRGGGRRRRHAGGHRARAHHATERSGGVHGYGGYFAGLHACPRCGGVHGYAGCPF